MDPGLIPIPFAEAASCISHIYTFPETRRTLRTHPILRARGPDSQTPESGPTFNLLSRADRSLPEVVPEVGGIKVIATVEAQVTGLITDMRAGAVIDWPPGSPICSLCVPWYTRD